MSNLFFWFVYFTLDNIYKVRIVFIVVLDRTTGQCPLLGNMDYQFKNFKLKLNAFVVKMSSFWIVTVFAKCAVYMK